MAISIESDKRDIPRELSLRSAQADDAYILWRWANDPTTRANSFNRSAIPWNSHRKWYAEKLASEDCRLWIMESDHTPAGQIRYDRVNAEIAQISLSLAPMYRGRGLGTWLLVSTPAMAARELKVERVRGIALSGNIASHRSFLKAGFTLKERTRIADRECLVFERGA
jgi:RimJ/RimL family protein N-acetyltransferase